MLQIIKKMNVLLDKKQKRTMVGLIILMVISAFLQTAGVGMLVEVMQIVMDGEQTAGMNYQTGIAAKAGETIIATW